MRKEKRSNILRFFKLIYIKLVRINDTPQKVAQGLGLGVFLGIIPGTGPIVALFLSFLFRVNRAACLLGSIITNTWLSIVTLVLSIRVGSSIMGLEWQQIYAEWKSIIRSFYWANLLKLPIQKVIFPVILGYFMVSLSLGLLVYIITLIVIRNIRNKKKPEYKLL